jgi:DNA mismatch repair protein MutS
MAGARPANPPADGPSDLAAASPAPDVDLASLATLTPMMRQYQEWKRRYPDYLLLFRLGDFYEAFHEDAAVAARTLDIALTSRQKGEGAIPMAGVPHHAVETYIARLIRAGLKVAVCDQVEAAQGKGRQLIRREVVRLVTPGTVTDAGLLDGRRNNFLAAVWRAPDHLGVASCVRARRRGG